MGQTKNERRHTVTNKKKKKQLNLWLLIKYTDNNKKARLGHIFGTSTNKNAEKIKYSNNKSQKEISSSIFFFVKKKQRVEKYEKQQTEK